MNRFVYTVFVFFWGSVTTLVLMHWLGQPMAAEPLAEAEAQVFSLAEVAEHDTLESCWMAIRGEVYDLTDYIPTHPTSPRVMERWCGTEATEGMETKGYGRPHSEYAWGLLERYRIGSVAGG